ncbi:hypothetical protein ABVK25_012197 [Lepraria finkii]|uniref:C2H2-type domain-containing protein n=1 Tax=Lepraria finkii TaxID=1340010 RepID=A0ABR4ANY2_9LECA
MSTYTECLASFVSWPHTSPTPEALAEAGFSHMPIAGCADNVVCRICNTRLFDWEPEDDPEFEHLIYSGSCRRFQKRPLKTPTPKTIPKPTPKPTPKDIGFLDLSLQHDFPDLYLFHDVQAFSYRIEQCQSEFLEADILALLPKCLRGKALTWFNQSRSNQDLSKCKQAMKAQFQQAAPQAAPQPAPQPMESSQAPKYHYCKLCNASFSSTARLIRHTQESNCNKPACNRYNQIFTSRNQLYEHLRTKCSAANPTATLPLPQKRLSTPATPPATPPPRYRMISPPPPVYKVVKNFLTIEDLYIRYAPQYLKVDDLFRMFGRRSA